MNGDGGGGWAGLLGNILKIVVVLIIIGIVIGAIVIIENWDYIVTFFTTGFVGWLNPFDSSDGDEGPVETAVGGLLGDSGKTALGLAWWWPGNWFN